MATILPERLEMLTPSRTDSLPAALQPWRRRLMQQRLLYWTLYGIIAGLLLACSVLLLARVVPWSSALFWAAGLALFCLLFALLAAWYYRPTPKGTARTIDSLLTLDDRLGTAWELRAQNSVLARLQRNDALKQLRKHTPAQTISLRPGRTALSLLGIAILGLALLLVLPNPTNDILRQQAIFQARMNKQIAAVDSLRKELTQQSTLSKTQQQQIDQILHDLEAKLAQAKNDTEAQQAIAQAQSKLDQLRNPQTANNAQGRSAAASTLQGSGNKQLSDIGKALANNDSKQLAQALQQLSDQINKMTPEQRSKLAQQLEQAANQGGQNPALSSALHDLAKSLTDGSQNEVSDASTSLQNAAANDTKSQAQSQSLDQTAQELQNLANSLASATDGSSTTQPGQNQEQGQGQTQGQGQGQAQAQGQGQGQGQGQDQGQGQGGQGNGGGAGGSNSAGKAQGKSEQVLVPGQISNGSSQQTDDKGNGGSVQPGSKVSYSQVIEQYNQMAHDAIDNSNVPPDLKDLIHNYFDSLEQEGQ